MTLRVLFRTDASVSVGSGHVTRCLTLAHALSRRGVEPIFLCNPQALIVVPALASSPFSMGIVSRKGNSIRDAWILCPTGVDAVVFDHYQISANEETQFRSFAKVLIAIDDLANRSHDVDLLFDPMPDSRPDRYTRITPPGCDIRCGPAWQLLRPEFAEMRKETLERRLHDRNVRRLFVCIGGTDTLALTPFVLDAVRRSNIAASVDIVMGTASPSLAKVKEIVSHSSRQMQLHLDANNVASLMSDADISIGGGGTMTWERCALGLPSIVLIVADNQSALADFFERSGAGIAIDVRHGLKQDLLASTYATLARNHQQRSAMTRAAAEVCDALGADRIVRLVLNRIT